MSKILSSFRLTELTKQNLKFLAKKYELSEAETIEAMSAVFANPENEHLEVHIRAEKIKNSKAYQKFISEHGEEIKELGIKF